MSNFRLNLPVDVPWTLIDASQDMMDITFCNKKYPSPFKSSMAIFAYEPKSEELPEEFCGRKICFLKISCSITGYQPAEDEKAGIVELLERSEVDYSDIEKIIMEYFGCYGVLLNVSVHPFDEKLKDEIDKYPRIIDFEPKVRDFYQAASETGEVLTASVGKVSTNKSYSSTDATQTSWNAKASAAVSPETMAAATGVPIGLGAEGSTGQVRTETDQENWGVTTDASRERRENQSTTTQLSQMYNLLTGYHTGTNRASFIMLPRPHILQPTDFRTFVQGLRVIEGIQDFFLIVARPEGMDKIKVDAHLQTGHFPEDIPVEEIISKEDQFEFKKRKVKSFSVKCLGLGLFEGAVGAVVDGLGGSPPFVLTDVSNGLQTYDGFEVEGWEFDPEKGDSGHKSIEEVNLDNDDLDDKQGISFTKHIYKTVSPDQVHIDISVKNKAIMGSAQFHREYNVFLRRRKKEDVPVAASSSGLLITQRSLCVQIHFGECISKINFLNPFDFTDVVIIDEPPFDLGDIYRIPTDINVDKVTGSIRKATRYDFAFKKGIIRKIQNALAASASSPLRYGQEGISYLQSKHFQKRLLKILPAKILDSDAGNFGLINPEVRKKIKPGVTLKELLLETETGIQRKFGVRKTELFSFAKRGSKHS